MGRVYEQIDENLAKTIQEQHVFFVATAPLDARGNLNLSPKGLDSFRILGPRTVAYLDLIGSGVETIAHLKENGRIVIMFCKFEGTPNIFRLHGMGRVVESNGPEFQELAAKFPSYEATRAIIVVDVARISHSCGFSVPLMQYVRRAAAAFCLGSEEGCRGTEALQAGKEPAQH